MTMPRSLLVAASLILSLCIPNTSHSNPRCECEYDGWVGDCKARVELKGNWFKVISDTPQCSRVDWYIEGQPQVTIVTDGAEMEEWLGQSSTPKIAIQSCKICRDSALGSSGSTEVNDIGATGTQVANKRTRPKDCEAIEIPSHACEKFLNEPDCPLADKMIVGYSDLVSSHMSRGRNDEVTRDHRNKVSYFRELKAYWGCP